MSLSFKKALKTILVYSLVAMVGLVFLLFVLSPLIIKYSTQSWLREQGLAANIELVGFNVGTGTFVVENARGLTRDNKGFSLDRALLEINWKPLFNRQVDIQRFEIAGLILDISSADNKITVAGIQLPANSQKPAAKKKPAANITSAWSAQIQQIELSNIKVCHDNPAIPASAELTTRQMLKACATLGKLKWQGRAGWLAPDPGKTLTAGITVSGDLLVEKLLYSSNDNRQHFMKLGSLGIRQFQSTGLELFQSGQLEIANVELLQHSNSQDAPYLASWRSLRINHAEFNQQKHNARIDSISLSGLKTNIVRSKSGISGVPVFKTDKPQLKTDEASTAEQPVSFAINAIQIDANSQLSFSDKTVDPVFSEKLSNISVTLKDIDSSRPEMKTPLSAQFKVGEYGEVNIAGTIQPFAERLTLDLKEDMKHFDLAPYSVYGKTYIGHKIRSGQMDLKQTITINNGNLDMESTLVLNKFRIESLQGEEAEKYKSDLGMPLSSALSLLRDKNDNIKLTIPVTGDINNPDFSFNDVISSVTSKVIKEAIISYYTPFGMVKLLSGVVDLATALRFEPVLFSAGKAELEQPGIDNLTTLSKLLSERPHVQLTLCGYPARSDILARYRPEQLGLVNSDEKKPLKLTDKQSDELLALFRSRMDNMKKYMVNELKVNPGQVLLCSEPDDNNWISGLDTQPEITISI